MVLGSTRAKVYVSEAVELGMTADPTDVPLISEVISLHN